MNEDISGLETVQYFYPNADYISVNGPVTRTVVVKDGKTYHSIATIDGSDILLAPHWLAVRSVPGKKKQAVMN
jgi:hypothetical protein